MMTMTMTCEGGEKVEAREVGAGGDAGKIEDTPPTAGCEAPGDGGLRSPPLPSKVDVSGSAPLPHPTPTKLSDGPLG